MESVEVHSPQGRCNFDTLPRHQLPTENFSGIAPESGTLRCNFANVVDAHNVECKILVILYI